MAVKKNGLFGVKCATKTDFVNKVFNQFPAVIDSCTNEVFSKLGEETVKFIRQQPKEQSWIDQTGNLRSSIGYAVIVDGKISQVSSFNQVKQGNQGTTIGKGYAVDIAHKLAQTSVYAGVVIVAGMEYAVYVERMKNKVVLSAGVLWATKNFPVKLEVLRKKIFQTLNKLIKDEIK
ncbi:MAG: hypothetical protein J6P44_02405 [Bacteroidales bacterium]|nr:hypothetical protein [Bacteroidales bacterium]